MTPQHSTAFQPLDARAAEMAGDTPPDRISVRDHTVEIEIGAFQAERDVTQRIRFSVVVEVAPSSGAATDDVDDILSYDAVTEAITAELAAERLNLLETLAERIADRILHEHSRYVSLCGSKSLIAGREIWGSRLCAAALTCRPAMMRMCRIRI